MADSQSLLEDRRFRTTASWRNLAAAEWAWFIKRQTPVFTVRSPLKFLLGYKAAVNRIIELYKKRREHSYIDPRSIAEEYAFLGDKDHGFEWLEKAYQEKSDEVASLRPRRCYDFLRDDPRYRDLERRVGYTW